jgi:hypothetical protein
MSPAAVETTRARARRVNPKHPPAVPILDEPGLRQNEREQPFAEGAFDAIDSDLRHRMISEAAYRRYVERGYSDGDDVDDWLQAEAEVDHVLDRESE